MNPTFRAMESTLQAINETLSRDYVARFLKNEINRLNDRQTCWHHSGSQGLYTLLRANISESPYLNVTIAEGFYNLSSSGNAYSIDFYTRDFAVNGVEKSTFITLSTVHIFTMAIAFFLVYPIILLLESITVLCDLVNRPVAKYKVKRWETVLQTFVFSSLVIAGLVTGLLAMGSSDHFRTEHGIIGIVTVVLAASAISLYHIELYFSSQLRRTIRGIRMLQNMHYADMAICQTILIVSGFALADGFDDFTVMSLCVVELSTSLSFSLGMIAVFIWNSAVVLMTAQWFLVRRAEGGTTRLWRLVRFRRRQRERQPSPVTHRACASEASGESSA